MLDGEVCGPGSVSGSNCPTWCTKALCAHVPDCADNCYEEGEACDPASMSSYGGEQEEEPVPCAGWCRSDEGGNTCGEVVCRSCDICEEWLAANSAPAGR